MKSLASMECTIEWVDAMSSPPEDGKFHVVALEDANGDPVVLTEMYQYKDSKWVTNITIGGVEAKLSCRPKWYVKRLPRPESIKAKIVYVTVGEK